MFSTFLLIYIKLSSCLSALVSAQSFCRTFFASTMPSFKKKKITKTDSLQSAPPLMLFR